MGAKPFSNTMRIDLIPETPGKDQGPKGKRRIVVNAPMREPLSKASSDADSTARSTSRYKDLLESIYDAVVITDYAGHIKEINARAVDFLQCRPDGLAGLSIGDLIYGASDDLMSTLLGNLKDDRFTLIAAYCTRRDGSFFPAEIAVSRLEYGDGLLCFFVRDITVRRQAEEMLRTEHNALQNARAGIGIVNHAMQFEYVNPALAGLCGQTTTDPLMGVDIRVLLDDQNEAHIRIAEVLDTGSIWEGPTQLKVNDRAGLSVYVAAAPNRNADGEIVGLVLSVLDLTDQERAEQAMREAERRRVMLESLGAACHHLGQPATVLTANLGLIRREIGEDNTLLVSLLDSSQVACEKVGEILHKMNAVAEYRTTEYLTGESTGLDGDRILEF